MRPICVTLVKRNLLLNVFLRIVQKHNSINSIHSNIRIFNFQARKQEEQDSFRDSMSLRDSMAGDAFQITKMRKFYHLIFTCWFVIIYLLFIYYLFIYYLFIYLFI